MADFYIGQIVRGGWNFSPRGTSFCNGQIIAIAQNTALFSLLGTQFGGNGQTTFALPDLRGRTAIGTGQGPGLSVISVGQQSGSPTVALLSTNMPAHTHSATFNGSTSTLNASNVRATTQIAAAGSLLGRATDTVASGVPLIYAPAGSATNAALGGLNVAGTVTVGVAGGSSPIAVRSPYLGLSHVIAVQGIFPSRN